MQHALLCGLIAALSFIGFICIVYFVMLVIYRPKGNSRYIIDLPHDAKAGEYEALLYGAYFRKMIFGDLIFDTVELDKSRLTEDEIEYVNKIAESIGCFTENGRKE